MGFLYAPPKIHIFILYSSNIFQRTRFVKLFLYTILLFNINMLYLNNLIYLNSYRIYYIFVWKDNMDLLITEW